MSETETKATVPQLEDIVLPAKKPRAKPKRFTTREQIIERIDKFTAKAKRQRDSQNECYLKAAQLRRHSETENDETSSKIKSLNRTGDGWGWKADRLERDVLPSLKRKLAEFDTDTIPGINIDKSIPGL